MIDIAGGFIQKNTKQIQKALISPKHIKNPVIIQTYTENVDRKQYEGRGGKFFLVGETVEKIMREILVENPKSSILLLGRYGFDGFNLTKSADFQYWEKTGNVTSKTFADVELEFLTVHRAKGLGYDNVIIINAIDSVYGFPSQVQDDPVLKYVVKDDHAIEYAEERRLFYVALTRAEKHCFISYAKSRYRYGKLEFADRSRFIGDISPDCLDMSGVSGGRSSFSSDKDVELPWKRKSVTQRDEYPSANVGAGRADSFSSFMNRRVVTEKKPEVMSQPSGVRRITRVTDADVGRVVAKSPGESDKLAVGKVIEHQRFGVGVIEALDGRGDDTKVTVAFKNLGRKQLLVKYAKFKVLN